MPQLDSPVAVQMWFPSGEGWAYHPALRDDFSAVRKAVDPYLKSAARREEFVVRHANGAIVGEKIPDAQCRDPKAAKRSPFILRCAYVTPFPSEESVRASLAELRTLHLPQAAGEAQSLSIAAMRETQSSRQRTDGGHSWAEGEPSDQNLAQAARQREYTLRSERDQAVEKAKSLQDDRRRLNARLAKAEERTTAVLWTSLIALAVTTLCGLLHLLRCFLGGATALDWLASATIVLAGGFAFYRLLPRQPPRLLRWRRKDG